MRTSALQIEHLMVNYEKSCILFDICLQVPQGQLVAILGPNGAGKTTFLKSTLGLLKPLSGKVSFLGDSFKKMRSQIAYMPQRDSIDWDFPMSVLDLVLMGCYGRLGLFRRPSKSHRAEAMHCLEKVGMQNYSSRQINQLSGGQKQRIFIARALMQKATLFFMDEPFSGVDQSSEQIIMNTLQELKSQGKTIFVVHHDLAQVQRSFDWVILLNHSLVAAGAVADVFTEELIERAYGKKQQLFDQASQLVTTKTQGYCAK